MVAIFPLDADAFFSEESNQGCVFLVQTSPEREFGLQVYAFDIRCFETGLRRTPRMEAIMINAILFSHLEVVPPRLYIHRRMRREGKDASIVLSPEEDSFVVNDKLRSPCAEVPQAKICRPDVAHLPRLQGDRNAIQGRVEFAPRRRVFS